MFYLANESVGLVQAAGRRLSYSGGRAPGAFGEGTSAKICFHVILCLILLPGLRRCSGRARPALAPLLPA